MPLEKIKRNAVVLRQYLWFVFSASRVDTMLEEIPVELATQIFHHAHADLAAISCTSRKLNRLATPVLYASITLGSPGAAILCCSTLARTPSENARYNLPALVRSFEILEFDGSHLRDKQKDKFLCSLCHAVEHMINLQRLAVKEYGLVTPRFWASITKYTGLKSLDVVIPRTNNYEMAQMEGVGFDKLRPGMPELVELRIDICIDKVFPESYTALLQHLITNHSDQLHAFSLKSDAWDPHLFQTLLGPQNKFPSLETLTIPSGALNFECLRYMPKVHTLIVKEERMSRRAIKSMDSDFTLSLDTFPVLTTLTCPAYDLHAILPRDTDRAVRTVCLDEAFFDIAPGLQDCARLRSHSPEWTVVLDGLQYIPNSKGPVTDLSFRVEELSLGRNLSSAIPFLGSVEKLMICHALELSISEDNASLRNAFFAQLPHLHTFIIGDSLMHSDDSENWFMHAHDNTLQRYLLEEWDKGNKDGGGTGLKNAALSLRLWWTNVEGMWVEKWTPIEGAEEEEEE